MNTRFVVLPLASDFNFTYVNSRFDRLVRIVRIISGESRRIRPDLDVKCIGNELYGISFIYQSLVICVGM
jgi:hypothetical protein